MIVSINTVHLPFAAELEFPLGLAKGEVLTLVVGEGNFDSFPKADDIKVDPLTKIVHIGLKPPGKTKQQTAEDVEPSEQQDQQKQNFRPHKEPQEVSCTDCSLLFPSANDVAQHKSSCARTNLRKIQSEVNGQSFELSLHCKQANEQQVELVLSSNRHNATVVQRVAEPHRITVSCWSTVPQSFYEDCIQLSSKLLTRHMPPTEETMTIRSRITIMANRVKTTVLEVDGVEVPTDRPTPEFAEIYSDFDSFLTSLEGTKESFNSPSKERSDELTAAIDSKKEASTSRIELRSRAKKRKRDPMETEDEENVVGDEPNEEALGESQTSTEIELAPDTLAQEETDDKIYCLICLKINRKLRFMNPHALETHMNNNHSVEVFESPECRKCSKKFVSADALQNHEKKCNPKFPKKCQVCNKSFAMGLHRDRHLREVHGIIKEHSCGICGQKYQSEKHRDWHLVTKHKESLSVDELERLGMEEIQCTLCEFRSYSSKGMQVHRQKEHIENEKAFRCPACGVGNESLAGIQEHINEKHGPEDRWWICQLCNRTFHRENADVIELHLEQHNRNTGLICVHCNKVFETETVMLDHVNRNHDKNTMPYICDICDQGSESYKDLLKHMLKHNPFKTSLYRLQRQHIVKRNIEEGIMFKKETRQQTNQVYGCDICNKQFDLEATLMAHRIVFHNDPGKEFYRCPVCTKAFKPHHLSYHLRLHSGERPHKCQYCEATFHTVASCSDHEIVKHTFAYKQRCPLCNKGFVSRAKTWQHVVRFHKESPEQADKILPPVTHKVLSILQKRRQTEEIKQLIENSSEMDDDSPSSSKRMNTSELFKTMRRHDGERELLEPGDMEHDDDDDDAHELRDEEIHEGERDENNEGVLTPTTEVEIAEGQLEVNEGTVVDLKGFEETETVEINDIPAGVGVDYPQPEVGLQYFRVVYADGTQTTLPIAPGESVVIEDEHGNQQIIDPAEQPD